MRRALLLTVFTLLALSTAAPVVWGQSFLGRPMKTWMADLSDSNPEVRRGAAFALGKIGAEGDTQKVVAALTHSLADKDSVVRDFAASGLGDLLTALDQQSPAYWDKTGPALRKALTDDDARVRRSAAYALGAFGPDALPAHDDLIARLADDSALVRQNAAWALGKLGAEAGQEGVAQLRKLLKDAEPLVRRDALHALGEVGNPIAHPAVSAMLKAVGSESDGVVRKAAVEALAHLVGPVDKDDAHELYGLLKDKDSETRYNAAFVLAKIGGADAAAQALPTLQEALKDSDPHFQEQAASSLGGFGKDAAPAVSDLGKALTEAVEPDVRRNAAVSLAKIGPAAKKALPEILQALQYSDAGADARYNQIRPFVAEALVNIGYPGVEPAIPAVLKILRADPDPLVRQKCLWSLFDVQDLEKFKITPVLTGLLDETGDETLLIRYDAARVLALRLEDRAPDKTVDVLLDMLTNRKLQQFKGTSTNTTGVGTEGSGKTSVNVEQGGDARYMAAEALGWLRRKANRPDVVTALQEAAEEKDANLKGKATEALRRIK
jgi:HEAT repeat protein